MVLDKWYLKSVQSSHKVLYKLFLFRKIGYAQFLCLKSRGTICICIVLLWVNKMKSYLFVIFAISVALVGVLLVNLFSSFSTEKFNVEQFKQDVEDIESSLSNLNRIITKTKRLNDNCKNDCRNAQLSNFWLALENRELKSWTSILMQNEFLRSYKVT